MKVPHSDSERSPEKAQRNLGIIRVPGNGCPRTCSVGEAPDSVSLHSGYVGAVVKETLKFHEWTFHGFLSILIAVISGIREPLSAPWKGAVFQWVQIPPGNCRSSR